MAEDTKKGSGAEAHPEQREAAPNAVQPIEPEDAYAAGGKAAEQRQVLAYNVTSEKGHRHPAMPAGLHSTGSFAEENSSDAPAEANSAKP